MAKPKKITQEHSHPDHHKDTDDELVEHMEHGELDEDLEVEAGRQTQVEEDEIKPWEAGFAEGESDEGQLAKDALTGKPLMDVEDVVEAVIDGKLYRFANEENVRKFREKKRKEKK